MKIRCRGDRLTCRLALSRSAGKTRQRFVRSMVARGVWREAGEGEREKRFARLVPKTRKMSDKDLAMDDLQERSLSQSGCKDFWCRCRH